jgi:hypothetical protein
VKRRDVHAYLEGRMRAYLAGRNESEIVADNVKVLKIEKVPAVAEKDDWAPQAGVGTPPRKRVSKTPTHSPYRKN